MVDFDVREAGNDTLTSSGKVAVVSDDRASYAGLVPSLGKRELQSTVDTNWHLSQIMTPPEVIWDVDDNNVGHLPGQEKFYRQEASSLGAGQTVYVIGMQSLLRVLFLNAHCP